MDSTALMGEGAAERVATSRGPRPEVSWSSVPISALFDGARRMEASTYLTGGFGLRRRLEAHEGLSVPMRELAEVWQPSRLKGFVVPPSKGLPFLSAGQVFEARPRVRKWLAGALVPDAKSRYVDPTWLLLSCSGEVGRLTAVYPQHIGKIITHDLLRIVPRDPAEYGWLYAYMKTPTFVAIARSSQYGHMIKHLEPEHVQSMPVALPDHSVRMIVGSVAAQAVELRLEARRLQSEADEMYADLINPERADLSDSFYGTVKASSLSFGRRRLDGQFHRADVRQVELLVKARATAGVDRLADIVDKIYLTPRYSRVYASKGIPYRSAGELFDVNAAVTKHVYAAQLDDPNAYLLHAGWIVMARSGQTYGLLGRTMVLTDNHEGIIGSDDLVRIIPDPKLARPGYIQTVLNHVVYGRPLVLRNASGTSVPHLDPIDIREVPIPRFDRGTEARIADLSDEATRLGAAADRLETEAVVRAESAVEELIGQHDGVTEHDPA